MSDHTPDEVAAIFKVERKWLMQRLPQLPHWRLGNQVRFSDEDIAAIRKLFHVTGSAPDASGLTSRSRRAS